MYFEECHSRLLFAGISILIQGISAKTGVMISNDVL